MKPYHPKTEARKQLAILYDMFLLARKLAVYSRLDQMDEYKKLEEAIFVMSLTPQDILQGKTTETDNAYTHSIIPRNFSTMFHPNCKMRFW